MIHFLCEECGFSKDVLERFHGKKAACPKRKHEYRISAKRKEVVNNPLIDAKSRTDIALSLAAMGSPVQSQMVKLGSTSLGGNIIPVKNTAKLLEVAFDSYVRRTLLAIAIIPGKLFAKFQTGFYADSRDTTFKALGVE